MAFLGGLLFDQIAGAGTGDLTTAELHTTIRVLLTAVTGSAPDRAAGPGTTVAGYAVLAARSQQLAFFLAGAAPHPVDLVCCQRKPQALAPHRAAGADGFRLCYLLHRGP